MSAIESHSNDEIVTLDDHVRSSEVLRNINSSSVQFEYELNDKATKAKLLKAAKRSPIEVEENSTSMNLVFSAGAWVHVAQPSVNYWSDGKEEKTCKIGEYTIKIGGVKVGKESSGKHVHSKVIFLQIRTK